MTMPSGDLKYHSILRSVMVNKRSHFRGSLQERTLGRRLVVLLSVKDKLRLIVRLPDLLSFSCLKVLRSLVKAFMRLGVLRPMK